MLSTKTTAPSTTTRLWGRSVQTNGHRDAWRWRSKACQAVVELEQYVPDLKIVREECVNHAHKRVGTTLLKLSREKKLGGSGRGCLTKEKGDQAATLLPLLDHCKWRRCRQHAGQGVGNSVPLHEYRAGAPPHSPPSWHFFQRALANDEKSPSHEVHTTNALAHDVAAAMEPVYRHMSDPNLL